MARVIPYYIDARKMRDFIEVDKYGYINTTITKLNIAIEKSRADVQEVRRGHWIESIGELHPNEKDEICSECGYVTGFARFFNYCPECGARMEE